MTTPELMDVGAQSERTALAWQRTGIGVMAVGVLLMRWDITEHLPVFPGILITVVGAIAVLVLVPLRYRRALHRVQSGHTPLSGVMVPATALFLVIVILGIGAEVCVRLFA